MNYKPGLIICPRTKRMIELDKCIDQIKMIASLPIEEKKNLPFLQLDDYQGEGPLPNEIEHA